MARPPPPERVSPFTAKAHPTAIKARWIAPYLHTHLDRIEAALGTELLRTNNGNLFAPLGFGEFGVAFATEDGRAVKLTTDDAEPVVGTVVQGWQQGPPGPLRDAARASVVFIDRIVRLPGKAQHQGHTVPVFGIVREGITPVEGMSGLDAAAKRALDAVNANYDGWEHWFKAKTPAKRLAVAYAVWDGWEILDTEPEVKNFALVQRHLWNLGIPLMDTYAKNFGWRQTTGTSQLVLFDLGGSEPLSAKDFIDPIDGDSFESYFPWKETLKAIEAP